ncbi:carboxymuconolactone decarboxylase family protein [Lactobacillus sp. DCY120]|uniref:Carboxymuconolactone decarboxylase family protein n=1 Tax=Bombilactobacillus apium TaxID=2675299 RepID=A0A850R8I1_9LACO|nr:carboxymuconolactone decarboxylase family protein [Bombilactobacillus apium]NVY97032.1 carboxymuconolactone decarboxylase family protein [Bombilactobacillus apium]
MFDYRQEKADHDADYRVLNQECAAVVEKFGQLHAEVIKPGKLSVKEKELIALGIAIADRCEGCIMAHVKTALKNGATMGELAETVEVAIMMGGGPSTVYGSKALSAAKQFMEQESH